MNRNLDILVIDDEPSVSAVVMKICKAEGMSVLAADHTRDALHCLEETGFRLILCDIMMPGFDGFQFLEELASRGIHTPVVMMTGYSTVENAVKSISSTGAIDYIPKPFTADELLTVILRSLRCGELMNEAESACLPGNGTMIFVPCPKNYYSLGYVSWALMEDEGTARIGVTDLFLKATEGVRKLELVTAGEDLIQGIPCAEITSADGAMHSIMCPLSGRVIEVNDQARLGPALLEKDPYFRGWLYQILPSSPASDLQWLSL